MTILSSKAVLLLITVSLVFSLATNAQQLDNSRWDTRFASAGIDTMPLAQLSLNIRGTVRDIRADGNDIVVGGYFQTVSSNVVRWNSVARTWESLSSGTDSSVNAVLPFGDDIYVAGNFSYAGGNSIRGIARWNKKSRQWYNMGKGIDGDVQALCEFKGEIYAAGVFSVAGAVGARNIARWNGNEWLALGKGANNGINGEVYCLQVYNNTLCIGGNFIVAGGDTSVSHLAMWDGTQWIRPSSTIQFGRLSNKGAVLSLGVHDSLLAVTGIFDSVNVNNTWMRATGLIVFDGKTWSSPVNTITLNKANGLQNVVVTATDIIVAASSLTQVNGILINGIARWDRTNKRWFSLGSGISNRGKDYIVSALCVINDDVYTGGTFRETGSIYANNISVYHVPTNTWLPVGNPATLGINGMVNITALSDGIYAYGTFTHAGQTIANGLARWSGSQWLAVGSGFLEGFTPRTKQSVSPPWESPLLNSIARIGNTLYVGGDFTGYGTISANTLVSYTNGVVSAVGGSMKGELGWGRFNVSAMCVVGNDLYAGGAFVSAGSTTVNSIARWDGTTWNSLANGAVKVSNDYYTPVHCLIPDNKGNIYAAGSFMSIGGVPARGIAKWDGSTWQALAVDATDVYSAIYSMALSGDTIYAGGAFSRRGGEYVNSIACWDGNRWHEMDGGISNGVVNAIALKGDELYVAGSFRGVGNLVSPGVAVWNIKKQQWYALGKGIEGIVSSIAFSGDTVFFGGNFKQAGGMPSYGVAAWLPAKPLSVEQTASFATSNTISLQPNPATSSVLLKFSLGAPQHTSVDLYDMLGRIVLHVTDREFDAGEYQSQVDISSLPNGMYRCAITTEHSTLSTPLSIVR